MWHIANKSLENEFTIKISVQKRINSESQRNQKQTEIRQILKHCKNGSTCITKPTVLYEYDRWSFNLN